MYVWIIVRSEKTFPFQMLEGMLVGEMEGDRGVSPIWRRDKIPKM